MKMFVLFLGLAAFSLITVQAYAVGCGSGAHAHTNSPTEDKKGCSLTP